MPVGDQQEVLQFQLCVLIEGLCCIVLSHQLVCVCVFECLTKMEGESDVSLSKGTCTELFHPVYSPFQNHTHFLTLLTRIFYPFIELCR